MSWSYIPGSLLDDRRYPAGHDRPDWDTYFLGIAREVARRAECTRRRVGSVLVRPDKRIASTGYNGAPNGRPNCLEGACPRAVSDVSPGSGYDSGPGTCIAIHSEANALIYARWEDCQGATLYVTTDVCDGCKKLIQGAGLARVVTPEGEWIP